MTFTVSMRVLFPDFIQMIDEMRIISRDFFLSESVFHMSSPCGVVCDMRITPRRRGVNHTLHMLHLLVEVEVALHQPGWHSHQAIRGVLVTVTRYVHYYLGGLLGSQDSGSKGASEVRCVRL